MLLGSGPLVAVLLDLLTHLSLDLFVDAFPIVNAETHDLNGVGDHLSFDVLVHARICVERWSMIHLYQPWLQLLIQHDIEAKQFIAEIRLLGLTAPIQMLHLWLDSDHSLDDYALDLSPYLLG